MLNKNIVKFNGELGYAHKTKRGYVFQKVSQRYYNSETDEVHNFNEFEVTTKEEQIEYLKQKFTWGKVTRIHEYNNFLVFEYLENRTNDTLYHVYINFIDTNNSAYNLDEAMVIALACKYDEWQAERYISKMLGIHEKKGNSNK